MRAPFVDLAQRDDFDIRILARLLSQMEIGEFSDTRVSDALADVPFAIYSAYGSSSRFTEALYDWACAFKISFPFVIENAGKTIKRWHRSPSLRERRSWALSSGYEWLDAPPQHPLVPAPRKHKRDGRDQYIAFKWLVMQHVFGYSSRKIAKAEGVDNGDVFRQIKWAAAQLGIIPSKPKLGRPKGAKTKFRVPLPRSSKKQQ